MASYHVGSRVLKGFALGAVLAGGAAAAADPQAAVFQSYLQSPAYRSILEKAYNDTEPAMLKAQCPALKVTSFDPPEIVLPAKFAKGPRGGWQAVDGAWVQRATLDRCGKPVVRRALAETAPNNGLRVRPLLPAEYSGGYKLEPNAIGTVEINTVYKLGCKDTKKPEVLDIKRVSKPNPGWTELWTLSLCGKTATARVTYLPGGGQTDIETSEIGYTK
ncbi:MAG TPA: hypothetical protein VG387_02430 [Rhizomicrobium sp.]|jgi:hypothetical protein|nr:hypothetical protein [Rhizomicrobium sp.]